jgi:hypothetical protein
MRSVSNKEKLLLDRLLKSHFYLEPDYSVDHEIGDDMPLKFSWAYNDCFDLKADSVELHDLLKDYAVSTGLHSWEYQNNE